MAKPEWGAKHTCLSCGAKFYEMGRNPINCPACEAPFAAAAPARTRRSRKAEAKVVEIATATVADKKTVPSGKDGDPLIDEVDDLIDDDDDDDDDVVALADDDDDDDDDVLAEADLSKSKISDE